MANKQFNDTLQLISRLMSNIVVKQEKLAYDDPHEVEYQQQFNLVKDAMLGIDSLYDYSGDITLKELEQIRPGFWKEEDLQDINYGDIPFRTYLTAEEERKLLGLLREDRIENYYEYNNYYRMLIGLPNVETEPKDFVYVDGKPIHQLEPLEILRLRISGKMDVLIAQNPDKKYLKYINRGISLIQARDAGEFEILWMPNKQEYNRFREMFNQERKVFLTTYHSEHLCFNTDYNEAIELTALKLRAILMYLIHQIAPTMDKNTYTKEESERLFREVGLRFPKDMSANYRDSISFVLNYLVMFKGTNYVVQFIAEKIFSGLRLYKYMIRKRHKAGLTYPIPEGTPPEEIYDVDFIMVPITAKNPYDYAGSEFSTQVLTYDEVVELDPKWRDSVELKRAIFQESFSLVDSKFLALDSMSDLQGFGIQFGALSRLMIEYREILQNKKLIYTGTGYQTDMFRIWIYYLALFTTFLEHQEVISPDTWSKTPILLGFHLPKEFQRWKVRWMAMFWQTPYRDFVENYPDVLNNDNEFMKFLMHLEKAVGLVNVFHDILKDCQTHEEINMWNELYRLVRIVKHCPKSYDMEQGTLDGKTYEQWLELNEPSLYRRYLEQLASDDGAQGIVDELDNCTQFLIDLLEKEGEGIFRDISQILYQANTLYGGISKYMMYILKMFKSYSVDFITESTMMLLSERYNYQKNLGQFTPEGKIRLKLRWNVSQYDQVVIQREDGSDPFHHRPIKLDRQESFDRVFYVTPYGEVQIS